MKKIIFIAVIVGLVGILVFISTNIRNEKPLVATTLYPYAWLARQIIGNDTSVRLLLPEGAEPHEYEPTPQDISTIQSASIVIINGGGIDPWAEKLIPVLKKRGITVLQASTKGENPHVWLDPIKMQDLAHNITKALIMNEPYNKQLYEERNTAVVRELQELDSFAKKTFAVCKLDRAIVAHDAFSLFGLRYGISFIPAAGLSHDDEPSAKTIKELVSLVNTYKLPVVFTDVSLSPKIVNTIARESQVETRTLDPVERVADSYGSYVARMKKNIISLQEGLLCQ